MGHTRAISGTSETKMLILTSLDFLGMALVNQPKWLGGILKLIKTVSPQRKTHRTYTIDPRWCVIGMFFPKHSIEFGVYKMAWGTCYTYIVAFPPEYLSIKYSGDFYKMPTYRLAIKPWITIKCLCYIQVGPSKPALNSRSTFWQHPCCWFLHHGWGK